MEGHDKVMSLADGMAAINLEMPPRVPRTEYSVESHWAVVRAVTGIDVDEHSSIEIHNQERKSFIKAWNYDFIWSTLIGGYVFGEFRTEMGHAAYAAGGVDFDTNIYCPFNDPEEVLKFDPLEVYGQRDKKKLAEDFGRHYNINCNNNPDAVNMTGIYVTCISGLIDILGWGILLTTAGLGPKKFDQLTNRYVSWINQYFEALAEADVPVVMIHDDIVWTSGPFIHPDWYRQYVFPNYKKLFRPLIDSGKKIIFTSDGNYTEFINDIADCGVHGFVLEPTTDIEYIAEKYGKTHVFIGNADVHEISHMAELTKGDTPEINGGMLMISSERKEIKSAELVYPEIKPLNLQKAGQCFKVKLPPLKIHQIIRLKY